MKINLEQLKPKLNYKEKLFFSNSTTLSFKSHIPKEKKFKIENLFEFKRTKGDLILSISLMIFVLFLLINFAKESGWDKRDFDQKRVGKILKQQWVGPLICMIILLPSAIINIYQSLKQYNKNKRLRLPNQTYYEISQWFKSFEFIIYFLIYTFIISTLGYLLSTIIFACFLTFRLGYRSYSWILTSLTAAFGVVIVFRTILQIKTPVNIWLYSKFPPSIETFMKIYF